MLLCCITLSSSREKPKHAQEVACDDEVGLSGSVVGLLAPGGQRGLDPGAAALEGVGG